MKDMKNKLKSYDPDQTFRQVKNGDKVEFQTFEEYAKTQDPVAPKKMDRFKEISEFLKKQKK